MVRVVPEAPDTAMEGGDVRAVRPEVGTMITITDGGIVEEEALTGSMLVVTTIAGIADTMVAIEYSGAMIRDLIYSFIGEKQKVIY